ncbi:S10 family peptidase [bacterium]|nr:S10 family peptidase [bacterium]
MVKVSLSLTYTQQQQQQHFDLLYKHIRHQGGPGGSSISVGAWTEMGYFQVDDQGNYFNEYAWNRVANMLYLESPAGSGEDSGFSTWYVLSVSIYLYTYTRTHAYTHTHSIQDDKPVHCRWNDTSQAEAYGHTLAAFYKVFPEFKANNLYLTGESYFGQYGPNIAKWILDQPDETVADVKIPLTGIALGNACWGGDSTNVQCNGPNSQQNDAEMYYGKGLSSKELYDEIMDTCEFPKVGLKCEALLEKQSLEVGPHNVYNIYDNCPRTGEYLKKHNATMRQLLLALRSRFNTNHQLLSSTSQLPLDEHHPDGGYTWSCGGMDAVDKFLTRDDVMEALHLEKPGSSAFSYETSGPASITLYPELVKKIRVFIYNGDADACVPYKGNEEWITSLVKAGVLKEKKAWSPWYSKEWPTMPAGYATTYDVVDSTNDFTFVTIRLAGHMVPTFQPSAALSFLERYLAGPW